MAILRERSEITPLLARARTVAVLGASVRPGRAGYYVPRYLHDEGFDIYPVNPNHVGQELFSRPILAKLSEVPVPIEVIDVFRRSEHLLGHLDEILRLAPLPEVVWFQLGVQDDLVARSLSEAGIDVVQNRCMLADHQRWL